MRRELLVVFLAAVLLYVPTAWYGYVQDDRAIIVSNPAAHSVGAALGAFDDPYWPRESGAGLYRPVTILSFAIDWTLSGGRAGWLHLMNALWHGVVTVLFVLVLMRWLPTLAAVGAGLVFAWHPVHVEAVASIVGRAELLAAAGILGAVLAARRGWWLATVLCAALAMFSKEHGVIAGVAILIDKWLDEGAPSPDGRGGQGVRTPIGFWVALGVVTVAFLAIWERIGVAGASAPAAVFYGRDTFARLAIALPAVLRATVLLFLPISLSSDYGPQVIPDYHGVSLAAILGLLIVIAVPVLVIACRRRAPAISFTIAIAALSFLPTSNLLFAGGIVLAERNLYLAVVVPATLYGTVMTLLAEPDAPRAARRAQGAMLAAGLGAVACAALVWNRLPAWRDNRTQLLTLLEQHPESYIGHASAAAVLAGAGDTAGARAQYRIADSLFAGDPYLDAARAIFLVNVGDSAGARPLVERISRRTEPAARRMALRAQFLFELRRGDVPAARAVADSAGRQFPWDRSWYRSYLQ